MPLSCCRPHRLTPRCCRELPFLPAAGREVSCLHAPPLSSTCVATRPHRTGEEVGPGTTVSSSGTTPTPHKVFTCCVACPTVVVASSIWGDCGQLDSRITNLCILLLNAPDCDAVHSIAAELREVLRDRVE